MNMTESNNLEEVGTFFISSFGYKNLRSTERPTSGLFFGKRDFIVYFFCENCLKNVMQAMKSKQPTSRNTLDG